MGPCVIKKMVGPTQAFTFKNLKNQWGPGPPGPLGDDATPGQYYMTVILGLDQFKVDLSSLFSFESSDI